jgi:hypothetical protein
MGIDDEIERLRKLPDEALLVGLSGALRSSRGWTALVLAHLAEVEERRLHLLAACSSMFEYCTARLGMSEDEACRRIDVARLARRYPMLYARLASGLISLSVAALLKHHLTATNHAALIAAVSEKTVRQAREVLAAWFPQPDVPASIRKLPERRTPASGSGTGEVVAEHSVIHTAAPSARGLSAVQSGNETPCDCTASSGSATSSSSVRSSGSTAAATRVQPVLALGVVAPLPSPASPASSASPVASPSAPLTSSRSRAASIKPLSPERYAITFTADAELKRKLELATDLLRHAVPSGDISSIVNRALDLLVEETLRRRFAQTRRPRATAPDKTPQPRSTPASADAAKNPEPPRPPAIPPSNDARAVETPRPSRRLPSAVRRVVLKRDGLRCTWHSADGMRCQSRAWLEHDHIQPRGVGGNDDASNLHMYCRAHNQLAAEQTYGKATMARIIAQRRPPDGAQTPRRGQPNRGASPSDSPRTCTGHSRT